MQEIKTNNSLKYGLTLCADTRLSQVDFTNDQSWELSSSRGEPACLAFETTYGLRARSMRIFPRFHYKDQNICNPEDFYTPILIEKYFPNYIRINYFPIKGLEINADYWITGSQVAAGQLSFRNHLRTPLEIEMEWAVILNPISEGQRMSVQEINQIWTLSGDTGGLKPVFFVAGGAHPGTGSYPAMIFDLSIPSMDSRTHRWAIAALNTVEASFTAARNATNTHWEAQIARIELVNNRQIDIRTGNSKWDQVIKLSQTIAASLIMPPSNKLPGYSFVQSRQPDLGFSIRGDGSDYSPLWNGQTVFDSFYISQELLPYQFWLAENLIENFLAVQDENGRIDYKPGLSGQRSQLNATPLICTLAWRVSIYLNQAEYIQRVFPKLVKFFESWFSENSDSDRDGVPEWQHPFQTEIEDHPIFCYWVSETQGVAPGTVESPGLCSMLAEECSSLMNMARLLGDEEIFIRLESRHKQLINAIQESWDDESHQFQYRDRDTHRWNVGQVIQIQPEGGNFTIQQSYPEPVRLLLHFTRPGEGTRNLQVFIHGSAPSGGNRIERISPAQFRWNLEDGWTTSDRVYTYLEKIVVEGLQDSDKLSIRTVQLSNQIDISSFLPLWAKVSTPEQAKEIIKRHLTNPEAFWQINGLPNQPISQLNQGQSYIHLPWNALIGHGLLNYGYRAQAAALMEHNLDLLVKVIDTQGFFQKKYGATSSKGYGEKNALEGLVPLGLLLRIIGVKIISPWRVEVEGFNPFPWPVTVKYCGMTILRNKQKTTVVFPDGQALTANDERPCVIALE